MNKDIYIYLINFMNKIIEFVVEYVKEDMKSMNDENILSIQR